ncbi:TIGR00341 family protein [Massilia yuzhufengensis]|uniref:TIGR00341 family protein n=1 Tax=Massilia yuzhufengensis TaxID=1164594 RepID=A0A1I1PWI7_9BURK|nr:TIGR00341 family protein [Massilia yuzhufengensis]SFD14281.1 TIGR00341 family protein [Massilia yuzhufengensis]
MNAPDTPRPASLREAIAHRFSLLDDKADDDEIDRSLRAGVELRGATPWILMFAIVIASVGLNTNSNAVIIGAMLVSPLMGPIVGLGYGLGIYDFPLVRRSLANLAIAAAISLLTSTLYFMLTPLDEAQSELLARTTPSLWDVLIALAGGLAGIIGQTRREKSNVLPGVAIATALMPPLCTAGYGLANGDWSVFGGAFYLFSINCVFIAFAAVIVIEFLRLPHRKFVDPRRERHVKRALLAVVLITGLPSIYLATRLVDNEVFKSRARDFVRREFKAARVHVLETRLAPASRQIEVTLIGPRLPAPAIGAIEARLAGAGLADARLSVHQAQAEDAKIDVGSLKADILADIVRNNQQALEEKDATIEKLKAQLGAQGEWAPQSGAVTLEFEAQYPQCGNVLVGRAIQPGNPGGAPLPFLSADCRRLPKAAEMARIGAWLKVRTGNPDARLVLSARRGALLRQSGVPAAPSAPPGR